MNVNGWICKICKWKFDYYCGKLKIAPAILYLTNLFKIKPYLIHPNSNFNKNWDNSKETLKLRPPTPPRTRCHMTTDNKGSPINDIKRKNSFN